MGDFEKAVEHAGGEAELVGGGLHKYFTFFIHLDEFFELAGRHFGVGKAGAEAFSLFETSGDDSFADSCTLGAAGDGGEFFGFEAGHIDMEVNSVEEGAGDFRAVFEALGGPDAVGFGVALESAGAGIHGSDEHRGGGEGEG